MRTKDRTVQCIFHPAITAFLFGIDLLYRAWGDELEITSGSEPETTHGYKSLHYATPCAAVDISVRHAYRISAIQYLQQYAAIRAAADIYCDELGIPHDWIDIILEDHHIHIEYQPKRRTDLHGL